MDNYNDIMQHPRYRLRLHRPMPALSRAAQFSAFAALTGFDEEIDETARLTVARENMCEDDLASLDAALQRLIALESAQPLVTVTFFQPDLHKEGGAYLSFTGHFRFYDQEHGMLRFTEQVEIAVPSICRILFCR